MQSVRHPAVAGMFYPADPRVLQHDLASMLDEAHPAGRPVPKAIIVPHAGYIYSGPVAASAYALLSPIADRIHRVVLLGPVHRVWVDSMALPGVDFFETPLGRIPIDADAVRQLADLPFVEQIPAAHALEHSLEVQLPFLQTVLHDFSLVPLVVGGATPDQVALVLDSLWGGDETLIVVSSDLSHYQPYAAAKDTDRTTVDAILHLDNHLSSEQACGSHPINGLLLTCARKGLRPSLLDQRNSGDTAGDKDRVVGYASLAFSEGSHEQ
jgi:AmmeMemoRadiSam system protein B